MKTKLYLWSKQIHRLTMFITSALVLVMAGTGMLLKYPIISDTGLIRRIHNNLSPIFGGALFIMMITGIYMYVFPLLKKRSSPPLQSN
jgi:hypothetical protein